MTLDELLDTCASSSAGDWNVITCWGADSAPSFLGRVQETAPDENTYETSHSMRAAYRPDTCVGIAWGYPLSSDWAEEWVKVFPDQRASSAYVDFFYNGMLVAREIYISVDGGRAMLPLPTHEMTITPWQRDFFQMLDGLEKHSDFDRYLRQAQITVAG